MIEVIQKLQRAEYVFVYADIACVLVICEVSKLFLYVTKL